MFLYTGASGDCMRSISATLCSAAFRALKARNATHALHDKNILLQPLPCDGYQLLCSYATWNFFFTHFNKCLPVYASCYKTNSILCTVRGRNNGNLDWQNRELSTTAYHTVFLLSDSYPHRCLSDRLNGVNAKANWSQIACWSTPLIIGDQFIHAEHSYHRLQGFIGKVAIHLWLITNSKTGQNQWVFRVFKGLFYCYCEYSVRLPRFIFRTYLFTCFKKYPYCLAVNRSKTLRILFKVMNYGPTYNDIEVIEL